MVRQEAVASEAGRGVMVDISRWQSHGPPPPSGGYGPVCEQCGLSRWVEIGGGPAEDVYHPNVDISAGPNVDIVCDLEQEDLPFHDGHAQLVKAIHSLQHLSRDGARHILRECYRILDTGGQIIVMIGDGDFILERLREDGLFEGWLSCLFHGPNNENEFGYHKWLYNFDSFKTELESAGFSNVVHGGWYNAWEFHCTATRSG